MWNRRRAGRGPGSPRRRTALVPVPTGAAVARPCYTADVGDGARPLSRPAAVPTLGRERRRETAGWRNWRRPRSDLTEHGQQEHEVINHVAVLGDVVGVRRVDDSPNSRPSRNGSARAAASVPSTVRPLPAQKSRGRCLSKQAEFPRMRSFDSRSGNRATTVTKLVRLECRVHSLDLAGDQLDLSRVRNRSLEGRPRRRHS